MKTIREGLFETNSSSTHTLSLRFKKSQAPKDKLEIIGDTVVIYGIDQSDFEYNQVYGERQKLNYLFTWMYIRDDDSKPQDRWDGTRDKEYHDVDLYWPDSGDNTIDTKENSQDYYNILKAIQSKYPEVKRICFKSASRSYFDHQTGPWEEGPIVDPLDMKELTNYLFNDHLTIEVGHD